jgi:hypothetical protein
MVISTIYIFFKLVQLFIIIVNIHINMNNLCVNLNGDTNFVYIYKCEEERIEEDMHEHTRI